MKTIDASFLSRRFTAAMMPPLRYVDASLAAFFIFVVVAILVWGIRTIITARSRSEPSAMETPFVPSPLVQVP